MGAQWIQTELVGGYADWSHDAWYANGLLGAGYSSYDNNRMTLGGGIASSNPAGGKLVANASGGYGLNLSGWKLSPVVGLQYTRQSIEGYTESGAGSYDLTMSDQTINSLRSKVGASLEHEVRITERRPASTGLPWRPMGLRQRNQQAACRRCSARACVIGIATRFWGSRFS
jgi:outer membrane autotransporter protein